MKKAKYKGYEIYESNYNVIVHEAVGYHIEWEPYIRVDESDGFIPVIVVNSFNNVSQAKKFINDYLV